MFGKAKNQNSNVWKAKVQNSNVWKSRNSEFQCLEKPKFRIPMFGKAKIQKNSEKFRVPLFGKAKNQNSNVWKGQNSEFQCLEKHIDILRSLNKGVFERCTQGCGC